MQPIYSIRSLRDEPVDIAGKKVVGFCGIANPDSFHNTLAGTGADIVAFMKFRDHYIYGNDDLKMLSDLMETSGAETAVTTLKDYVKLERIWPEDRNLCYIKINLAIDNEDKFIRLIRNG